jgi:hypothetical protein
MYPRLPLVSTGSLYVKPSRCRMTPREEVDTVALSKNEVVDAESAGER